MTEPALDFQIIFRQLEAHFGPQQWWPAETPFEVIVGAILASHRNQLTCKRILAQLERYPP